MIYIFHGDNQLSSRNALNELIDQHPATHLLKLDNKEVNQEKVNMFLHGTSLFADQKVLVLTNYFSLTKAIADKVNPLVTNTKHTVIIWQDKSLSATQLKTFPSAKTTSFTLPKTLFTTLYSLKPKNSSKAIPLLLSTLKTEPYELFLYLLKAHLRKLLKTNSLFDSELLKKSYLSLIELEFQTKTGTLSITKEIALERILLNLMR